ncbi:MAG: aspartyl/asparaginyl beta-hydroxylase domain-containing protein [Pelagibacteraceae bacterium]|nr:aspartyl/asparaginyl beta-hydroxylase domain-containing protein [Pelagibacteraceae bacterium]
MNNSTLCESDFSKVEDLKFDILKLRKALKQVLSRKEYDDAVGTKYIAGISLNQIPGDPDSIKGENVKGIYWTKPDSSGKEAVRAKRIDETKYTEFVKDLEDTYFKEVYDILSKKFKLGRVRILLKEPRSTLSWHRDPEPRLHIPIITNPGCIMVIEEIAKHLPADGSAWVTNNMKYHNFFNGGEEDRIHLVACLTDYRFN